MPFGELLIQAMIVAPCRRNRASGVTCLCLADSKTANKHVRDKGPHLKLKGAVLGGRLDTRNPTQAYISIGQKSINVVESSTSRGLSGLYHKRRNRNHI